MFKKLFNKPEKLTNERLNNVCSEYGASVYPKQRVADILPIENSGISAVEFSFALKSHFDFVVWNKEDLPLFAVEFDGPLHENPVQATNDKIKNLLCERFGLPLLRINSSFLLPKYRNMDILSWLVHVWFMQEGFDKEQQADNIPEDEIFDPFMIMTSPGMGDKFPFWLSAPIRIKIQNLCRAGKCKDYAPNSLHGIDQDENIHIISWLRLDDLSGVTATLSMHKQNSRIIVYDLLSEIVVYELYDLVTRVLNGELQALTNIELDRAIDTFRSKYK